MRLFSYARKGHESNTSVTHSGLEARPQDRDRAKASNQDLDMYMHPERYLNTSKLFLETETSALFIGCATGVQSLQASRSQQI